jgi:hypothetical protein
MPPPELVKLHDATGRLASKWGIPSSVTEQIVKAVLQGDECFVRGRRPGEMGLRDISREISREFGSTFPPAFLFSQEFVDVEIDWNGLLEHGRKLVPTEYEDLVQAAEKASSAKKTRSAKPDANYEQRATDYLIGKLELNRGMQRKDAWQACAEKFPKLSDRAIVRRVWKNAKDAIQKKAADSLRSYVRKT